MVQSDVPQEVFLMPRVNLEEDIRPLSEFRADAAGMIQKVRETKRALVLTQRGHSSAVLLDIGEYQHLLDELELLRDLRIAVRQVDDGQGVSHSEAQNQALSRLRA
jgi:prevent-host-death family protein